ncbi:PIR protein [Plasmodium yoelii]|uniref:PIR protein n=2 Tax=Plasmodium yoelii TaxID=5861 RepID=A0AAE9WQW0_PLAYO|nr:PIR protein [Plasmodium yoelii]WBY57065.1 PIR protein [Plasmodium yoelii yoelii]CDS44971.1 YIR protein [Plasmodium yoelii]VTZ78182.1 PIR protein [Plasmodium yoelii]|eukprot:XP_022811030.1 PIR protein [Plasmodium yoelii]
MDKDVCKRFKNVREWVPDQLSSNGEYQIKHGEDFQKYCTNECNSSLDKISAGCLYLLNEFFRDSSTFELVAKENFYIVEYILIWLSYMLNLIKTQENVSKEHFYNTYIMNGSKYTTNIKYIDGYNDYKDLIDTNEYFLNMDMSIISKLYDAFNILCDIYNELDTNGSNCEKCSQKANKFVETYKKIIIDHNITDGNSYLHVVFTLFIYYDNLKKKCKDFSSIPNIENIISEATSSSSIASKLIPILSILVAIAIFLGISYKYSLFGFRKRFQKQKLREKLKNIKKKMNRSYMIQRE